MKLEYDIYMTNSKKDFIILETEDYEMKINMSEIDKSNIDLKWAIENKSTQLN